MLSHTRQEVGTDTQHPLQLAETDNVPPPNPPTHTPTGEQLIDRNSREHNFLNWKNNPIIDNNITGDKMSS